jgi:hypothetical protein
LPGTVCAGSALGPVVVAGRVALDARDDDQRQLALDADLAKAEPKTLRYRILHTAAQLARSGRRRRLRITASWP